MVTENPFANFSIITKAGDLIGLVPNSQQREVLAAIAAQRAAGVPVRLLILKARQIGFSTISEAVLFLDTFDRPHRRALVAAHDDDSSEGLFRMTKLFEEAWPAAERKPTEYSSKKEIAWAAPHRSQFQVQTAGKLRLGRGSTIHSFHGSEVAWWTNATETLLSVLQAVPDDPDTMVILETTANGIGGEFWERWQQAVRERREHPDDLSGYLPLFFSWLDYPEYRMKLPEGYEQGEPDEDEEALVELGADAEQLYWRRRTIIDKCGGNVNLYNQEYPSSPEIAFQQSGRAAIDPRIIRRHRSTIEEPRRARLTWDKNVQPGGVRIDFGDFPDPCWYIYRTPEDRHDYTVGGDVAEGELSDPADATSNPDFHGGLVLDRVTTMFVAEFNNRTLDADEFGEELLKAAWYYNYSWASPEANAAGLAAVLVFKRANYSRLYRREGSDESVEVKDAKRLAWKTTTANRDLMIDDYLAACRPDPIEKWADRIVCPSQRLVEQEETFHIDKTGKRQHRPGCFDDLLFAGFICWQLHLRCPRTRGAVATAWRPGLTHARYADGVDLGVPEDDNYRGAHSETEVMA